jgi:hypothetical protein
MLAPGTAAEGETGTRQDKRSKDKRPEEGTATEGETGTFSFRDDG